MIPAPILRSPPSTAKSALPRSLAWSRGRAATAIASSPPLVARAACRLIRRSPPTTTSFLSLSPGSVESRRGRKRPLSLHVSAISSTDQEPPQATAEAARWRWDDSEDAVRAYGALAAVLVAGAAASALEVPHASLPYFVGLASVTIYCGAHRGLTARRRQEIGIRESMLLPIGAATTLVCIYLFITFFKDLDLSAVVNAYFFVLSSAALFGAAAPPLRRVLGGDRSDNDDGNDQDSRSGNPGVEVSLPRGLFLDEEGGESVTRATLRASDAAALALALTIATADALTNHQNFTLSNACAAAVAADVLQLLGLRSFKAAGLLLGGLACYDVLAVFASGAVTSDGESVMGTVALAASGPTRLLFPRSAADLAAAASASPFPFSLLGLGDVAIPGLLACLALKYDASRSVDMKARAQAAARAIDGALAELSARKPDAGDKEYGDAAADAAAAAFEVVAEAEARARDATVFGNGASSSSSSSSVVSSASSSEIGHEAENVVTDAALSSRVYFQAVMGAYALGLLLAFAINAATGSGQPALLYLCPATLGAVAATAARRQEVERILSYKVAASKPLFAGKKKV